MEVSRKEAAKQALLERIDIYVKTVKEELAKCGFRCVVDPAYVRIIKEGGFTEAFSFRADVEQNGNYTELLDLKLNSHYNELLGVAGCDQELGGKAIEAVMVVGALNSVFLNGFVGTESDEVVRDEEKEMNVAIGSYLSSVEEGKQDSPSSIRQLYENMVSEFNRDSEFKYELIHDRNIEQKLGFGHGYRTRVTFLVGETRSGHRDTQYVFNYTMLITDYVILSNRTHNFAKANDLSRDDIFGLLRFAYFDAAISNAFNLGYVTDSDDDRCYLTTISHAVINKARKNEVIDKFFKEVIGNFGYSDPDTVEINALYK